MQSKHKRPNALYFVVVKPLSHVRLFVIPWITARQASLSITNSRSSPKPMSIELVMPSSHLILCHPLFLMPPIPPSIRVFSSESTLWMRWRVSASASVLPMNTQDWSPLGWTGWISLQSKGLSRVFSKHHSSKGSVLQRSAFFLVQLSGPYMTILCFGGIPFCVWVSFWEQFLTSTARWRLWVAVPFPKAFISTPQWELSSSVSAQAGI